MKPLTLHPHEIRQCLQTGSVLVVRPVKPQPTPYMDGNGKWEWHPTPKHRGVLFHEPTSTLMLDYSPFSPVGSQLFVKEKWRPILSGMLEGGIDYYLDDPGASGDGFIPWNPARTMKQQHSRLTLTATAISVKRVQEVTDEEALDAGVTKVRESCYVIRGFDYDKAGLCHSAPITPFAIHWDATNPKHPWETNVWCWMATMERVGT